MYAEERQRYIHEAVHRLGKVDASTLIEELDVTGETIRRDLTTLERRGELQRTHGGAIRVERLGFEPGPAKRKASMVPEKATIAKAALHELPDDGSILLDAGTTLESFAKSIPPGTHITAVTHALNAALTLSALPDLTLMLLGGRWRSAGGCTVEEWTLNNLSHIVADVAFIGTNGLSTQRGLTTSNQSEAVVKSAMIGAAHKVIVLADRSKFGTDYFYRFAELSAIDSVITDAGVNSELAEQVRLAGPKVDVA